ncbi:MULTISPECIES: S-methyl-5-thioribose-1-phosphate isomerase [Thermoactinomyces]|jgi:methylthioribose-1-phosphate isomerase|uniref:Methylthioribose-1-phosphate isomerase n=1 Tax=Thermoactinomyces daqus TaxID=1329516 RepID=A0A7W1X9Q8_9BACL|nr:MULTISPECIES: S-methyl-5-thioribose-1-phosphate isomerase [Thermoactinomyces]MBA4542695.1 S-methyl-5-thioribose-1-phosphate isomerase [Thermoactinomyces daqus]MBH8597325.1 S-methyl-5-thioribose-1-phosphate isomerase [Thermoactinomyces sp. CICC 10523]
MTTVLSVEYRRDHVLILDQTLLPQQQHFIRCTTTKEVWECIHALKVRGAPAIGMAAAFGLAVWANRFPGLNFSDFLVKLEQEHRFLASSRPTAVNLFWALERVTAAAKKASSVPEAVQAIENEAMQIQQEDEAVCRKIGEHALELLKDGDTILTICNAGAIATARYGTALAPMHLAKEYGKQLSAYACETRPLLQGGRLTTWELLQAGIDVTLITDNMSAHTMRTKGISAVIVGCDRVAANGDTANKIGTFGLALQARALNIPFYVAAPTSTIDLKTPSGEEIPIEERNPEEVTHFGGKRIAPEGVKVFNPAFDVTPHEYITAIITENGIAHGDYARELPRLVNQEKAVIKK